MATLSNANFRVDILTGMPHDYQVSGTVNVELDPFETMLVNMGLPLKLQSKLWGEDSGRYNDDDDLFSFTTQNITAPGIYSFTAIIPRGTLNEDNTIWDRNDEVYNTFSLVSGSNLFAFNTSINSPTIHGRFG